MAMSEYLKNIVKEELQKDKERRHQQKIYKREWENLFTYAGMQFVRRNLIKCIKMLDFTGAIVIERRGKPKAVLINFTIYRRLINLNELMHRELVKNKINLDNHINEAIELEEREEFFTAEDPGDELT